MTHSAPKNRPKKKKNLILILMLLLLITLFVVQCQLDKMKNAEIEIQKEKEKLLEWQQRRNDSLQHITDSLQQIQDSLLLLETMIDSLKKDTVAIQKEIPKTPLLTQAQKDSTRAYQDSIQAYQDSLKALELQKQIQDSLRKLDTIPPEAFLSPPPGRYYHPIKLQVKCQEADCTTWIAIGDTTQTQKENTPIEYNKTGRVFFRAEDSLGNSTAWTPADYDMASDNQCEKNAYPVPVEGKIVCVDAYEYPNKPDELPRDMVSHEQAASLCSQAGKRLCSLKEWQAACKGKDSYTYSYGNRYHPFKCNTNSTKALRSGRKDQCRSWWGMYDMNGNLWEWTSTPSPQKEGSYLVVGGSWDGQNTTQCTDNKFSFYPQNQYPFVGFRCCQ